MRHIRFNGTDTLSFRQIDELNGLAKGDTFRLFKRRRAELEEGVDYFYLPAGEYADLIERLRQEGRIYATTVHLVLIGRGGYEKLSGNLSATEDSG